MGSIDAVNTNVNVLVAVPCALNEQQLLLIKKVLHNAGVNKMMFVQNGVCARANLEQPRQLCAFVFDKKPDDPLTIYVAPKSELDINSSLKFSIPTHWNKCSGTS